MAHKLFTAMYPFRHLNASHVPPTPAHTKNLSVSLPTTTHTRTHTAYITHEIKSLKLFLYYFIFHQIDQFLPAFSVSNTSSLLKKNLPNISTFLNIFSYKPTWNWSTNSPHQVCAWEDVNNSAIFGWIWESLSLKSFSNKVSLCILFSCLSELRMHSHTSTWWQRASKSWQRVWPAQAVLCTVRSRNLAVASD